MPDMLPRRNRLASEDSPYLLQHASNPVDWMPWGDEAFALARTRDKPVFLSIGYSTCHWCHVMERESFTHPGIAAFLNQHFVSIKVDREERPDVDQTYLAYVQAVTGHGGWPMTVFLTPAGRPFFGGTYFPPDDRHGRTGFLTLLVRIEELWRGRREEILRQAEESTRELQESVGSGACASASAPPAREAARRAVAKFARRFDEGYGGFGRAPKFPRPAGLAFLLEYARRFPGAPGASDARRMALATLCAMEAGGIHDHLGGGFHRYSVDRTWHIPHYEKMLYDQAQLVPLFLEAGAASGNAALSRAAARILEYVDRDLSHPDGGFFCAEDADSLPTSPAESKREGAFYVFTEEEIRRVLPEPQADVFCRAFGVKPQGNVDPLNDPHGELAGTNTLYRACPSRDLAQAAGLGDREIDSLLEDASGKMFAFRSMRPRPHRDEKILCGWNGLMLGAFALAGRRFGRHDWVERAERAAACVQARLWNASAGILFRSAREKPAAIRAFATDYAQLIHGLLELHAAGAGDRHLDWALVLQDAMDHHHLDPGDGTYFSARADGHLGILSLKDDHDGAEPSANALAALNHLRLWQLTGAPRFRERTRAILAAQSSVLREDPHASPLLVLAALREVDEPATAVLHGCDLPEAVELADWLGRNAPPETTILRLPSAGAVQTGGAAHALRLRHMPWMPPPLETGKPVVQVCRNQTCGLPVESAAALAGEFSR